VICHILSLEFEGSTNGDLTAPDPFTNIYLTWINILTMGDGRWDEYPILDLLFLVIADLLRNWPRLVINGPLAWEVGGGNWAFGLLTHIPTCFIQLIFTVRIKISSKLKLE
jgi:hypothetical protein